ncbi:hypothetical protein MTAT_20010 [Moorella thermoacetica]|uniref:DNA recombination-mediator protein A n=1 Tax=Neomoorella thermoacetica TaxID=1525 RepID=A0AAC9HJ10_NEOTH|nr:DNA-processing protein DprA [Moorella thermoacetica]AOQ24656.1 DNA recombination-mediator protein A [Moorella thermoacetica]TYL12759.1 hypothetical protein MTAT_20010 [Moorella thermoacetica]
MVIAVIGTRKPAPEVVSLCERICVAFRDLGCSLVTGNAMGIDGIARDVWNERAPERVTLILPWAGYNRQFIRPQNHVVVFENQKAWKDSVRKYHPAAGRLSVGGFKLHARNFGIIEAADVVIAFPSNKPGGGGTGQGIRIARDMGKPLFILPQDLKALRQFYVECRRDRAY